MPPLTLVEEVLKTAKGCLDIDILNDGLARENEGEVKCARINTAVQHFIKAKCSEIMGEKDGQ